MPTSHSQAWRASVRSAVPGAGEIADRLRSGGSAGARHSPQPMVGITRGRNGTIVISAWSNPMYRLVEHTSEIEIEIEASSAAGVLTEAATAFGEVLVDAPRHAEVECEVRASADDLPTLLAEWLGELAYLAETDGFIPERVVRIDIAGTAVEALLAGHRSQPQCLVKGVTYHRLEMARADRLWRARVVLDV